MNWITTNVRLPEDVYMDLKLRAAQERRSVSSIIREKIAQPAHAEHTNELLSQLASVNAQMMKSAKGKNLTARLIKSRYEHV